MHSLAAQKWFSAFYVSSTQQLRSLWTIVGQEDYVFDALALHDHLHLLRPILADPAVLKVTATLTCSMQLGDASLS